MALLFGTHTKSTTVIRLRGCSVELQGLSKVIIQDTLVFSDVLGWPPLSQKRQEARLIVFYKIINGFGLAPVPFEGVLVEAYMGTRRNHNMKFRQIGHITGQYGQSFS